MIYALRGELLQVAFLRIVPWTVLSSVVVYVGALEHGNARAALWAAAVAIDLIGAGFGFYVPGLGGSDTREWTISGAHFAERCQAFVLIALGESIVVTGTRLAAIEHPTGAEIAAFVVAFAASAGLWWIYFDRAASDSARVIEQSDDPGRLARNAFHWIHPLIVGGIIVAAAADEIVLDHPSTQGHTTTSWLVLGGAALYLGGHALFKAVIWRLVSWPRVIGTAVCLALFALAPHVSALVLSGCALAVIVGVAVADRVLHAANRPA
jgi:low temperature requirement protein LtrA